MAKNKEKENTPSNIANSFIKGNEIAKAIGFPLVIIPSDMFGKGKIVVHNKDDFEESLNTCLHYSLIHEVSIEKVTNIETKFKFSDLLFSKTLTPKQQITCETLIHHVDKIISDNENYVIYTFKLPNGVLEYAGLFITAGILKTKIKEKLQSYRPNNDSTNMCLYKNQYDNYDIKSQSPGADEAARIILASVRQANKKTHNIIHITLNTNDDIPNVQIKSLVDIWKYTQKNWYQTKEIEKTTITETKQPLVFQNPNQKPNTTGFSFIVDMFNSLHRTDIIAEEAGKLREWQMLFCKCGHVSKLIHKPKISIVNSTNPTAIKDTTSLESVTCEKCNIVFDINTKKYQKPFLLSPDIPECYHINYSIEYDGHIIKLIKKSKYATCNSKDNNVEFDKEIVDVLSFDKKTKTAETIINHELKKGVSPFDLFFEYSIFMAIYDGLDNIYEFCLNIGELFGDKDDVINMSSLKNYNITKKQEDGITVFYNTQDSGYGDGKTLTTKLNVGGYLASIIELSQIFIYGGETKDEFWGLIKNKNLNSSRVYKVYQNMIKYSITWTEDIKQKHFLTPKHIKHIMKSNLDLAKQNKYVHYMGIYRDTISLIETIKKKQSNFKKKIFDITNYEELIELHDELSAYKGENNHKQAEIYKTAVQGMEHLNQTIDDVEFKVVATIGDLAKEAGRMNNCVYALYRAKIIAKDYLIIHGTHIPSKEMITIGLERNGDSGEILTFSEMRGINNSKVTNAGIEVVKKIYGIKCY
jgi:mRNA-degrading endonuclease HigB of HigAB toxin-antitoxin module